MSRDSPPYPLPRDVVSVNIILIHTRTASGGYFAISRTLNAG